MKLKEPKYKYTNVMLIDDNELDNFINEKTLEAYHFAKIIYTNTSAISALEFLSNMIAMGDQHKDAHPEVIFIDINMPGINGFQFLEAILKMENSNMKKCKLAILTSSVHPSDQEKAKNISKDIKFIIKPLTVAILNEM